VKTQQKLGAHTWQEGEHVIPLRDSLEFVRRRIWVVVITAFVLASTFTAHGLWQTPVYEASVRILVSQKPASGEEDLGNLSSDVQGLQQFTQTVAEAADSRRVADGALRELNLQIAPETLLSRLSVQQVEGTQFVDISYRDPDPTQASKVANAVADVASEQISQISPNPAVTATVWEPAQVPEVPASPDVVRDGVLALLLGIILGLGLAYLLERLNNNWRLPEETERVSGVPILAVVPKSKSSKA
jgi:capsular polysaccharide biosynthesis protein